MGEKRQEAMEQGYVQLNRELTIEKNGYDVFSKEKFSLIQHSLIEGVPQVILTFGTPSLFVTLRVV